MITEAHLHLRQTKKSKVRRYLVPGTYGAFVVYSHVSVRRRNSLPFGGQLESVTFPASLVPAVHVLVEDDLRSLPWRK